MVGDLQLAAAPRSRSAARRRARCARARGGLAPTASAACRRSTTSASRCAPARSSASPASTATARRSCSRCSPACARRRAGRIAVGGTPLARFDAGGAHRRRRSRIPPDRQRQGVVAEMTVRRERGAQRARCCARLARWAAAPGGAAPRAAQAMVDALRNQGRRASMRRCAVCPAATSRSSIVARALAPSSRACWSPSTRRAGSTSRPREAVVRGARTRRSRAARAVLLISTDLDEVLAARASRARCSTAAGSARRSSGRSRPSRLGALMAGSSARRRERSRSPRSVTRSVAARGRRAGGQRAASSRSPAAIPPLALARARRGRLRQRATACRRSASRTCPLLLTGLAVAIAFRAGVWNIGAEGQLLIGAVASPGSAPRARRHARRGWLPRRCSPPPRSAARLWAGIAGGAAARRATSTR